MEKIIYIGNREVKLKANAMQTLIFRFKRRRRKRVYNNRNKILNRYWNGHCFCDTLQKREMCKEMIEKIIYIVLGILFEIISVYSWWCYSINNWNFIALFFAILTIALGCFFFFRVWEVHKSNAEKRKSK